MSELKVLSYLGNHVNIVNLLGACTVGGEKTRSTGNLLWSGFCLVWTKHLTFTLYYFTYLFTKGKVTML